MRRCIPINMGVHKCFGSDAMNTAYYNQNVLANEVTVTIPYEKWYVRKLNLN
jgi:hypothetical protein